MPSTDGKWLQSSWSVGLVIQLSTASSSYSFAAYILSSSCSYTQEDDAFDVAVAAVVRKSSPRRHHCRAHIGMHPVQPRGSLRGDVSLVSRNTLMGYNKYNFIADAIIEWRRCCRRGAFRAAEIVIVCAALTPANESESDLCLAERLERS